MGDSSITALMSMVIRDRRTKGGLSCSSHESMRPVAVCERAGGRRLGGGGRSRQEWPPLNNPGTKIPNINKLCLSQFHNKLWSYVSNTR